MAASRAANSAGKISLRASTSDPVDPAFLFTLTHASLVHLAVYDVQGRLVATPLAGQLAAGPHTVHWQSRGSDGRPLSRGVYFARLESEAGAATTKFVYLGR